MLGEDRVQPFGILDIDPQIQIARMLYRAGKPRLLETDIVIIVEIVDPDHRIAPFQETQRQGRADETGAAGDEDVHEISGEVKTAILNRKGAKMTKDIEA